MIIPDFQDEKILYEQGKINIRRTCSSIEVIHKSLAEEWSNARIHTNRERESMLGSSHATGNSQSKTKDWSLLVAYREPGITHVTFFSDASPIPFESVSCFHWWVTQIFLYWSSCKENELIWWNTRHTITQIYRDRERGEREWERERDGQIQTKEVNVEGFYI